MTKISAAGITVLFAACFLNCAGVSPAVLGGNDFLYSANQYGGITIIKYRGSKKNIIIPDNINGLPVNIIGRAAFAGKGLVDADMPETLIRIEDKAFMKNKLRNMKLPAALKYIGDEAFKGSRLETLSLPEGITEIGYRAFEKNKITEIKLPLSLKITGDYCFADNRVKSVEFPESMNAVPAGMFAHNNIVILRLPEAVRLIGAEAFADNPIEALSFWGGQYVEKNAFADTKLKVIGIAENTRFDSPHELGAGFQNAYKSMGGRAGIYYKQTDNVWWVKE